MSASVFTAAIHPIYSDKAHQKAPESLHYPCLFIILFFITVESACVPIPVYNTCMHV